MRKNGRHIRELHVSYYWALEVILETMSGLGETQEGNDGKVGAEAFWNLQRLSIVIDGPAINPVVSRPTAASASMTESDIQGSAFSDAPSTSSFHPINDSALDAGLLVTLLKLSPHLTSFELHSDTWSPILNDGNYQPIADALSKRCLSIQELGLSCSETISDENFASLIKASTSGWRKLNIQGYEAFGSLSSAVLVQHAYTLRSLDAVYCGGFVSRDIQTLLSNSPHLRRFWTLTEGETISPSDAELNAADIGQSEWVCTSLEIFGVVINGIPRPDITIYQDGTPFIGRAPVMTLEQGRALQSTVHRHLGSLTALKELHLGHDDRDWGNESRFEFNAQERMIYQDVNYQYECLEMTLETGLGLLSELKQLEVLDVTRMSHRIGVAEVQWMSENWPRLRMVSGLLYEGEPVPECVTWLHENRPDIVVDSHESNFVDG
ncbi:hypothetical protein BGX26_002905 [Mortierella sp. AD094]|nr:hypothetical protein BGX26_002905 [Mortierella sp. AD094]